MSFMEKRRTSSTTVKSAESTSSQGTGAVTELSPSIEQLSFPEYNPLLSGPLQPLSPLQSSLIEQSPVSDAADGRDSSRPYKLSGELPETPAQASPITSPTPSTPIIPFSPIILSNVTRVLPEVTRVLPDVGTVQTGMLPVSKNNTSSLRQPVVIRATGKKSKGIRPPQGRRMVVNIAVITLLSFIIVGSLLAVLPADTSARANFNPFTPIMKYFTVKTNNTTLLAQQAATATAVTQDGFDPGGNQTYAGLPTAPAYSGGGTTSNPVGGTTGGGVNSGPGGPGRFFYGQCTYWANLRYHALTGLWVPWLGNADAWAYGASVNGWVVSSYPHLHAIIVLQPGVQGAGPYGHVAIVESISGNSVYTSNYNWAGNWGVLSYQTFYVGPGVSFVWAPGY